MRLNHLCRRIWIQVSSHISDNILQKLKGRGVPLGKQSPFIPFRRVWKDSTHFPLASEGPASCSCVQMWYQVPPARCRAQAGFEVGVSYSLPSEIHMQQIYCKHLLFCAIQLPSALLSASQCCGFCLGNRKILCSLDPSVLSLFSLLPTWPDLLNHKGHTFCWLTEAFQSQLKVWRLLKKKCK